MSIDNLSEAELTAQLESEIQALNGGTNPTEELAQEEDFAQENTFEEDFEQDFEQDEEFEEETEEVEENKTETKAEKKIKKLLHQRNSEKQDKLALTERISKLETELADKSFYENNKEALAYKEEISELVSTRWLTREEWFLLIAWKRLMEQNKKINSDKTSMIWNTPWVNKQWVDPKNMPMSDLENLVKSMYSAGNINI